MNNEVRLIDANRLIRTLRELEWITDNPCDGDNVLEDIIDNAPTVDTTCPNCDSGYAQGYSDGYLKGKEERPQGHWVAIKNKNGTILAYSCSECEYNPYHAKISDYCPNCGADMRVSGDTE